MTVARGGGSVQTMDLPQNLHATSTTPDATMKIATN